MMWRLCPSRPKLLAGLERRHRSAEVDRTLEVLLGIEPNLIARAAGKSQAPSGHSRALRALRTLRALEVPSSVDPRRVRRSLNSSGSDGKGSESSRLIARSLDEADKILLQRLFRCCEVVRSLPSEREKMGRSICMAEVCEGIVKSSSPEWKFSISIRPGFR